MPCAGHMTCLVIMLIAVCVTAEITQKGYYLSVEPNFYHTAFLRIFQVTSDDTNSTTE